MFLSYHKQFQSKKFINCKIKQIILSSIFLPTSGHFTAPAPQTKPISYLVEKRNAFHHESEHCKIHKDILQTRGNLF